MSEIEEYFKDKIDWKFLNYLKDRTTEFEDEGCKFNCFVSINSTRIDIDVDHIYYDMHFNDKPNYAKIPPNKTHIYINGYMKFGLCYVVRALANPSALYRYLRKVQNKCEIIYKNNSQIIVKKKDDI